MVHHGKQSGSGQWKLAAICRSQAFAYGFAVVVTVLTLLGRLSIASWAAGRPMLIIFFLPILFSAYVGGLGPGLLATFIAAVGADYYLIPPTHSLTFVQPVDFVQWVFLVAGGVVGSGLSEALRRARRRADINQSLYAVTLASIGDAVITTDKQGRVTFLNNEAERLTGWKNAEAAGQPLPEVFHIISEQTRMVSENPVEKVFRTGTVAGLANHTVLIARDGREFVIDDSAAPIRQADGAIIGVVLVFRDNTEKKHAVEALQESQALYRSLVDQLPAGVFRKDAEGRYVFVNSYFCGLRQATPDLFLGRLPAELPASENAFKTQAASHHEQIMRTGQPVSVLDEYHRADGATLHFNVVKSPVFNADGKIIGSQGILFDVTGSKEAEAQLQRLAAIVESSDNAIIGKNIEGVITSWNRGAEHIFGYTAEEAIGRPMLMLMPPDREHEERNLLEKIGRGESVEHFETVRIRKDGKRIDVSATISPIMDSRGKAVGASQITRDVTEQKLAAEKIVREQARFKLVFDTLPIGIAFHTVHPDGSFARIINDAHLRICGLTREQHDHLGIYAKISHPDDQAMQTRLHDQVKAGITKHFSMEKRYLHPDGKTVWVNFSYQREIYPDGTTEELTTVADITERKRLEEQLRQSQKMEAIGQLAGGVAHDFNNILAIIQLQVGLLETSSELLPLQQDFAREIGKATQRAANLTRQLLLFSRKQALQPHDLDLHDVVTNITKMLQRTLGEAVHLQFNYHPGPLLIHADLSMMEQILVNLAVNSRDAMLQGGRLIIETSAVELRRPPGNRPRPGRALLSA